MVKHRCPLWSRRAHLSPELICVDELHTLHSGEFQHYTLHVMWECINYDVLGIRGNKPQDQYHQDVVAVIRGDMQTFYRQMKTEHPDKRVYEIAVFSSFTIGSPIKPKRQAKAAESGSLMLFASHLAVAHRNVIPNGTALVRAGRALQTYLNVTSNSDSWMLTQDENCELWTALEVYLVHTAHAGIHWKPKRHLMIHLIQNVEKFGNPRQTATWLDESLNRDLAKVAKASHTFVWSRRIISSFAHIIGSTARMSKKQKGVR